MGLVERLMGEEPSLFDQWLHFNDLGSFGEYLTQFALNKIDGYSKVLSNVYIPYHGTTSEIDVLMLHVNGIFVFESKNYSGWIFGGAQQSQWTQCLANHEKRKFYNPILQNSTHIRALSTYLDISPKSYRSYIIFSQRCTLKAIPQGTDEYCILKRPEMLDQLRHDVKSRSEIFTKERIDELYQKLIPLTKVTNEEKQKHIDEIHGRLDKKAECLKAGLCPWCGGKLVERNGKYGKFTGCSNYPRCHYILK